MLQSKELGRVSSIAIQCMKQAGLAAVLKELMMHLVGLSGEEADDMAVQRKYCESLTNLIT